MEIVPQDQHLVAELKLPMDSVAELVQGLPMEMRLLAFEQRTTPPVGAVWTTFP